MYLASGIVYICTRKKEGLGDDIPGLVIWSWLTFIIGIGFLVCHLAANKKAKNVDQQ
ncbi:hypothetical protein [Limosilactobacillus reuteri]|uniref:hypothetical protein n=1 Tax=Limosilactobacillus reuteri TaxID=1598 RepID=UPI000A7C433C|nr:hypothetical protein [Limosilactobacillus reuteri]